MALTLLGLTLLGLSMPLLGLPLLTLLRLPLLTFTLLGLVLHLLLLLLALSRLATGSTLQFVIPRRISRRPRLTTPVSSRSRFALASPALLRRSGRSGRNLLGLLAFGAPSRFLQTLRIGFIFRRLLARGLPLALGPRAFRRLLMWLLGRRLLVRLLGRRLLIRLLGRHLLVGLLR